ncbi:MAG: hypothetical protein JF586_20655 [Burkholderiales bacterium]|nr:hypothetical protein [Burkholderiales bacterium]
MTRATAFASLARAARRVDAASCALAATARAASVTMHLQGVFTPAARSPGPGRS